MDQHSEGTISSNHPSRRTFLKGAGLAAAAGLAAPLLSGASAHAASQGLILGINAPDPWDPSVSNPTWQSAVKGALGCRSYRDTPFKTASGCPTAFPGETEGAGPKVVASIRPDPDTFLNTTQLDAAIKNLIEDGARNFSAPQLTVWHEAGNLYTNPNGSDGNGGAPGGYDP